MYISIFHLDKNASGRYIKHQMQLVLSTHFADHQENIFKNQKYKTQRWLQRDTSCIVSSMDQTWLRPALIGEAATG